MAEFSPKFKEALSLVQKPGRYTGGEPGCVYKDKSRVDVRMAFCFPDTYEIGMSKRSSTTSSTATKTGGASARSCPGPI